MKLRLRVLTATLLAAAALPAPLAAQSGNLVARWNGATPAETAIAPVLTPEERNAYRQVFTAIGIAADKTCS
jgi:hypothetical protein